MAENLSPKRGLPDWIKSDLFLGISTFILWLGSAAYSLYTMFEFQMMVLRIYIICCSQNRWGFSILRQWSSIFIIGIWLAFTIITGEYHYQNVGQPKSWKLFSRSYVIISLLFIFSLIIG
jgi:hypothetical protein